MKLTILGSGTCLPTLKRNSPGYYLEARGKNFLIDCGSGTLRQMVMAKIDYLNLDCILITHYHPDHISDLVAILQSMVVWVIYAGRKRNKTLKIYGPKGFKKIYKKLREMLPFNIEPYPIKILEFSNEIKIGKIIIITQNVPHKKGLITLGLRIIEANKILVYTSDTDYHQSLFKLARNADLLITDCSYPDQRKAQGHMTPSQCAKLATEAHAKKLVLSHLYPICEKYNLKKQAQKHFQGPIIVARDLMRIKI